MTADIEQLRAQIERIAARGHRCPACGQPEHPRKLLEVEHNNCACGSYAINDDPERVLCDVCLQVRRADELQERIALLEVAIAQYRTAVEQGRGQALAMRDLFDLLEDTTTMGGEK
jgi:uncharacterized small protein (DUF1192 family)